MNKSKSQGPAKQPDALFDRIVTILEAARGLVVRAVNTQMVTAYWLIGREIVEAVQGGEERAEYVREVIANLSIRLTHRYGKGFSERNLQVFRQFYLAFRDRIAIPHPMGAESQPNQIPSPTGTKSARKLHLPDGESASVENQRLSGVESGANEGMPCPSGRELTPSQIRYPSGTKSPQGFSPHLSWSHYRALMRVEDRAARDFYEREAPDFRLEIPAIPAQ